MLTASIAEGIFTAHSPRASLYSMLNTISIISHCSSGVGTDPRGTDEEPGQLQSLQACLHPKAASSDWKRAPPSGKPSVLTPSPWHLHPDLACQLPGGQVVSQ